MNSQTMVRLAVRNTLRRKARTALTAGMVVVSVALLVLALSILDGVMGQILSDGLGSSGHVRIVTTEFAQKEELQPLYARIPDVKVLAEELRAKPGIVAVEPRLAAGVTVTVGTEIGDVAALAVGGSERYFREKLGAKDKLAAGAWFSGAPDELIAGQWVVEQAGAKVGDELVLLGATQDGSLSPIKGRLIGVVSGPIISQQVFLPLERMQYLADVGEGATELLVYTDDFHRAQALAASLRGLPSLQGLAVQPWTDRDPWRTFTAYVDAMDRVMELIIGLLTALGIWNTMTMSVLERTSEIGVLRAMGMSRGRVLSMVVFEAVAIALAGGLGGVLLALGPTWYFATVGVHLGARVSGNSPIALGETMRSAFEAGYFVTGVVLGVVMALVGSVVPALRAASIPPVAAMRTGR
jgi:putative ABC transport system permease protein